MKRIIYVLLTLAIIAASVWLLKNNYHKPVIRVAQINAVGDGKKINPVLKELLEERYRIVRDDRVYDIVIDDVFNTEDIQKIKSENIVKIFLSGEAFLPDLDNYDLVLAFDHIDDPRYIRYPYYLGFWKDKIKVTDDIRSGQGKCNPHKEKFACFLVSNGDDTMVFRGQARPVEGTKARDEMFHKLSEYKFVASGGSHLNNIGGPLPRKKSTTQKWLSQCKFIIAYENQSHEGYITEKVFQAYFAGAIPIYWGDKTTLGDINKDAIIYAGDFNNADDVVEYIKKVDNDDELYCKIWNNNLIVNSEVEYETVKDKIRKKLFEIIDRKLVR